MFKRALRAILGTDAPSASELYYRELLSERVEGAPTRAEAERDFSEALRARYGRTFAGKF